MAILPTKFIVRTPGYPQDPEFGEYCANSSKELAGVLRQHQADGQPMDLDEINAFFQPKLQHFFVDRVNERNPDGEQVDATRVEIRKNAYCTPLNATGLRYMYYARKMLLAHPKALGGMHTVNYGMPVVKLDDRYPPIQLTAIERIAPVKEANAFDRHVYHMTHPACLGDVFLSHFLSDSYKEHLELATAVFGQALNEALGTQKLIHSESREEAALKAYYLYSHIMPFNRYSSSAARMLLEGLAEVTGLETHHLAKNRDINLEALTHDWSAFKRAYERGYFWDKKVTSKDVKKWQAEVIQHGDYDKMASSPEDYVHDAMYVEAMGDKAELFSERRAMLRELIERTKNPTSTVSEPVQLKVREKMMSIHGDNRVRDISNPVTLQVGMVEYQDQLGVQKKARGIQFGCRDWNTSDIPFKDLFSPKYVFYFSSGEQEYVALRDALQEPNTVLTEDGQLVHGTFRAFEPAELTKLKQEFARQQRQSPDGYVVGASPVNVGRAVD